MPAKWEREKGERARWWAAFVFAAAIASVFRESLEPYIASSVRRPGNSLSVLDFMVPAQHPKLSRKILI